MLNSHRPTRGIQAPGGIAIPQEDKQTLLRRYAAGDLSWHALQTEHGFDNYRQVLAGLGELGLPPPIAAMEGPNVEARNRGRAIIREALQSRRQ